MLAHVTEADSKALIEQPEIDCWMARFAGHELLVPGDDFARRLLVTSSDQYGRAWEEPDCEAYIGVLCEVQHDLAYWVSHPSYHVAGCRGCVAVSCQG